MDQDNAFYNEVEALEEKASIQGYLTPDDLLELSSDSVSTSRHLHALLMILEQRGVEIVEQEGFDPGSLEDEADHSPQTVVDPDESSVSSNDTIKMYLKEMSHVPLLRAEEEHDLAIRIENGRAAQSRLLNKKKQKGSRDYSQLEGLVQDGLRARDHLIKANTRLVVSIAKKYIGHGVLFLDLIQEGNLGLMKAVEKYDVHRGFRFSTYATWWIRQMISRSIADQARTIRVPVHMIDRISRMYKVMHELEQRLDRAPTVQEISDALGLSPQEVQWITRVSWLPVSLEAPIGDDDDSDLGLFIEDKHTPTPMQSVYESMLREKINSVLDGLSPREARILRLRFGLDDGMVYTLEQVGKKFGLTRERVRQIEGRALRRLRNPHRSQQLKEYL